MNEEVKILFEKYSSKLDELKELYQDENLPRTLRLYDIRLRLALDIEIDFKGEVSLTRTITVRDTYALLIRLMEIWNSYEALTHFIREKNPDCIKLGVGKSMYYSEELLQQVGSLQVLKTTLQTLKEKYKATSHFKEDLDQYLDRISNNSFVGKSLKNSCKNTIKFFQEEKEISGIEILSLIYAERNMYYHNGETAKMGMTFPNRKYLLREITTCFYQHILLLTIYILNKEIIKNS